MVVIVRRAFKARRRRPTPPERGGCADREKVRLDLADFSRRSRRAVCPISADAQASDLRNVFWIRTLIVKIVEIKAINGESRSGCC